MNPAPAPIDEFEQLLQEVEREIVLDPGNKLEILRRYARYAKAKGGTRAEFGFIRIIVINHREAEFSERFADIIAAGGGN
ncbi:MAG: hypothetical protein IT167_29505 [Bryobacterales bacterium]|nr:hypothetical protein [Bryobacterales bacterium]